MAYVVADFYSSKALLSMASMLLEQFLHMNVTRLS